MVNLVFCRNSLQPSKTAAVIAVYTINLALTIPADNPVWVWE